MNVTRCFSRERQNIIQIKATVITIDKCAPSKATNAPSLEQRETPQIADEIWTTFKYETRSYQCKRKQTLQLKMQRKNVSSKWNFFDMKKVFDTLIDCVSKIELIMQCLNQSRYLDVTTVILFLIKYFKNLSLL